MSTLLHSGLPFLVAFSPLGVLSKVPQEETQAIDAASPEARAGWEGLVGATRGAALDPITSFHLKAEVLIRDGAKSNETRIDYRFLAPDCIRFLLPDKKEVGRFGPKQRDYWLRDRDEVVPLAGKDYAQDRRQIADMHSIATNFVALSDPSRLRITSLEKLAAPPAELGSKRARETKDLVWLRVASPDFQLTLPDVDTGAESDGVEPSYVVDMGAMPEKGLLRFAIIRAAPDPQTGRSRVEPMLIRMDRYRDQDGFRIPLQLFVYRLDGGEEPPTFADRPAQEIYILGDGANLRAGFTVEDFKP